MSEANTPDVAVQGRFGPPPVDGVLLRVIREPAGWYFTSLLRDAGTWREHAMTFVDRDLGQAIEAAMTELGRLATGR